MILEKLYNQNEYVSNHWNIEKAYRYVIQVNNKIVEASYFKHYMDNTHIKDVIELPTSFGCSIGCKHCASSILGTHELLNVDEIIYVFQIVLNEHFLAKNEKFLVTFTGIGETALLNTRMKLILNTIQSMYPNIYFVIGTLGFDTNYIKLLDDMANKINIKNIQISYLHHDINKLFNIIPNIQNLQYNFQSLINTIKNINNTTIRINYVVIENLNNQEDHLTEFISLLEPVKHKIIIRLSNLHETAASKNNNYKPVVFESLKYINKELNKHGISSYIYSTKKNDNLNCGQLAYNYNNLNQV